MPAGRAGLLNIWIFEFVASVRVSQVLRHPALAAVLVGGVAVVADSQVVAAGERGGGGGRRRERFLVAIDGDIVVGDKSAVGVLRASSEVVERSVVVSTVEIGTFSRVAFTVGNLVLETY